jgi:hypothetical protein
MEPGANRDHWFSDAMKEMIVHESDISIYSSTSRSKRTPESDDAYHAKAFRSGGPVWKDRSHPNRRIAQTQDYRFFHFHQDDKSSSES